MANDNSKVRYTEEEYAKALNALEEIQDVIDEYVDAIRHPICKQYAFCSDGCPFVGEESYLCNRCYFNVIRNALHRMKNTMDEHKPIEVKELTVAQIEELLGYKVKVVKE